uniref:Uncharacterized protein n=1 Tax=Romanomermis culicivorax TaxID=13658 RepID=A0A915KNH4_ROMCU
MYLSKCGEQHRHHSPNFIFDFILLATPIVFPIQFLTAERLTLSEDFVKRYTILEYFLYRHQQGFMLNMV